ncbi:hypothetical protein BGZ83_007045 [Gryganskiella cystojenkinii]|nr:hypothetical protein BGZ83_007045 [Gryganskiella cystojenkinii]
MANSTADSLKQRHRHHSDPHDHTNSKLSSLSSENEDSSKESSLEHSSHALLPKKEHGKRIQHRVRYHLNRLQTRSAWSLYLGFLFSLILVAYQVHYSLPTPVMDAGQGIDPRTGLKNRFSEANVRKVVRDLSEGIGFRVVGTEQDVEAQVYLQRTIQDLKEQAQREAVSAVAGHLSPKFEVWTQVADGSHQFDFMSKVVMKTYTNMTNIIVRLSCGETCDENAILLNGHYDTTLGSPGAVDDALAIGVMLEIIRIVSQRPAPQKNSLIFLFNGGEESLQDASHSFITNHELKEKVRAVINLEGCGTTGPEILFQANSRPMIDAYGRTPYPHGNVIGNDLFQTGIILSDTDFRQFVDYGNLTGLDLAVYKNSYLYHTHLDLDQNLEPGLPQHLGENTLAMAIFLAEEGNLTNLQRTASVVYFDVFGQFFVSYSMRSAALSHLVIVVLVIATLVLGASRPSLKSLIGVMLSLIMATLAPNLCAIALRSMGKSMIWFSHEWLALAVFGPASAAGMLWVQWLFHDTKASTSANEISVLTGVQMFYSIIMVVATMFGIASSYFLAMYALFTTLGLVYNYLQQHGSTTTDSRLQTVVTTVDFGTYIVASSIQVSYYMYLVYSLFDLIIPLTGRIGVDAPVDHIVAVMTGLAIFSLNPPILAFAHRFGARTLKNIILSLVAIQVLILIIGSATLSPFDTMHPKRIFVQHLRNISSGDSLLYVAHADPGPFYDPYVKDLETLFDTKATKHPGALNPGDWKSVYPFSQFLDSYVLDTTPFIRKHTTNTTLSSPGADGKFVPLTDLIRDAPRLVAEEVSFDPTTGLRKLRLLCTHPNYIWTVTSFDAEVQNWSLSPSPLSVKKTASEGGEGGSGASHYVVRNAGGYRSDGWRLDLEYIAPKGDQDRLRIELTAMETEGFGKDVERELEGTGEIGVMRRLVKAKPDDVTLTYFSAVVTIFEL